MQEVLDAMHKNRVGWQEHDDYKLEESQRPGIYFGNRIPEPPALTTCEEMIERFCSFKMLGVWHQDNLKWNTHIEKIAKKACEMFSCLSECRRNNLSTEVGVICYQTKIRSLWEYRAPIWGGIPQYLVDELESIQTRSLWILGLPKDSLPSLLERRYSLTLREYEGIKNDSSKPCNKFMPLLIDHPYSLKNKRNHPYCLLYTDRHKQSFIPRTTTLIL